MVEEKNKSEKKLSKFFTRFLSGVVLLALLFLVLYIGDNLLLVSLVFLTLVGLVELFRVFNLSKTRLGFLGYILAIFYYIVIYYYRSSGILLFLITMLMLLLMFYVFSYPLFNIKQVSLIFFGLIYVAVTFSFIYLIREKNALGKYLVWLIFIASWGSDTSAYCVGMIFGRHKLSPILSPKKTIEGAIGGIVGASIIGAIFTYFVLAKFFNADLPISLIRISFACAVGAIISMLGDLTASAIKRDYKIKDYGDIIPGHGGILDRFDSVIFATPALFFILNV